MTDEIVRYVKQAVPSVMADPVYLGVVVGIGPGKVGWAKTHENDRDKWDRKKGLLIARGRAALAQGCRRRGDASAEKGVGKPDQEGQQRGQGSQRDRGPEHLQAVDRGEDGDVR